MLFNSGSPVQLTCVAVLAGGVWSSLHASCASSNRGQVMEDDDGQSCITVSLVWEKSPKIE